jgi:altronate dehydratase large subunit
MSTTASELTGYLRADGRFGLRNHVLVLSTVALTARLATLAAAAVPETVLIAGDFPRGLRSPDPQLQARILEALVAHPNVGGALVLCHDKAAAQALGDRLCKLGKPVDVQAFMSARGMSHAVDSAQHRLRQIVARVSEALRVRMPLSSLTLALECGGSDATSALAANPAIGQVVDRVIAAGGTAIVSETAEFVGAEAVIHQRAETPRARDAILAALSRCESALSEHGENYRGVNPTEENIAAGLTTLIEKSMGAVSKTGTAPFRGGLAFGEAPPQAGLWFMDTPFFSPVSLTGMVAAGAQLTLFAMGVFNPSGNPLSPTIKVCGNPTTISDWSDSIDVDVSDAVTRGASLEEMANRVDTALRSIALGAQSRAELWREGQIMIPTSRSLL